MPTTNPKSTAPQQQKQILISLHIQLKKVKLDKKKEKKIQLVQ